ncbi:hypothetical protein TIFTF001_003826 [Ficus carica]|uniref:Bifunctional inhibitor/plant lipid transfer protein/seed storage helical domain-containing protein n=1 Tax=Ficus carica TaxID=3494 RepID=A0AA88DBE2_FICCA|nr:hypothetical protein TIFTF001_003826 [Ficus carica]
MNLVLFALVSGSNNCSPQTKPVPNSSLANMKCPRDALKLGVCADVLKGAVGTVVGSPPDVPCCSVLDGLLDLEAAVCLCTAIKANILGINLNIPISLSLLISTCSKNNPSGFQCA